MGQRAFVEISNWLPDLDYDYGRFGHNRSGIVRGPSVAEDAPGGAKYELYRIIYYLQDHSLDDRAMSIIPRSHVDSGCWNWPAQPCGEDNRGYIERPYRDDQPISLMRPKKGDLVIFDMRLGRRTNRPK